MQSSTKIIFCLEITFSRETVDSEKTLMKNYNIIRSLVVDSLNTHFRNVWVFFPPHFHVVILASRRHFSFRLSFAILGRTYLYSCVILSHVTLWSKSSNVAGCRCAHSFAECLNCPLERSHFVAHNEWQHLFRLSISCKRRTFAHSDWYAIHFLLHFF